MIRLQGNCRVVSNNDSSSLVPSRDRTSFLDEPCSALDPTSTLKIEETIRDCPNITIVIVTHHARPCGYPTTAFFLAENELGYVIEQGRRRTSLGAKDQRTLDYVNGRFIKLRSPGNAEFI